MKLNLFRISKSSAIAILVACTIGLLFLYLKIHKNSLQKPYTQFQDQLNSKYRNKELDKKFLNFRVTTAVDKALTNYNRQMGYGEEIRLPKPTYAEKPVDTTACYTDECKSLGGEMRLCSPWSEGCLENNGT